MMILVARNKERRDADGGALEKHLLDGDRRLGVHSAMDWVEFIRF